MLRLLLRRSFLVPAAVIELGVALAIVMSDRNWVYNWEWAIDWANGATILLAPVAAGVAAWDGWRLLGNVTPAPTATADRPWKASTAIAAAHSAASVGAWLVGVAVALGIVVSHGARPVGESWVLFLHPPAILMAASALGVLAGACSRKWFVAPGVMLGAFLVIVTLENVGPFGRFLTAGGHTAWAATLRPIGWFVGLKVLILAAASAAALAAAASDRTPGVVAKPLRSGARTASVAAALGLFVGGVFVPTLGGEYEQITPQLECVGSQPTVCIASDNVAILEPFDTALRSAFASLEPYGIEPPARYIDAAALVEPTPDSGILFAATWQLDDGVVSIDAIADSVATPAACPEYFGDDEPTVFLDAASVLREWVVSRASGKPMKWNRIGVEAMPDAAVDDWAREAYGYLRTCDSDGLARIALPIVPGDGGADFGG